MKVTSMPVPSLYRFTDSSEEIDRAKDLLKAAGGEDIASSGEKGVSTHTAGDAVERDAVLRTPTRTY